MASEAQLRANRANAKRSTGPKTAAGKGNSSQNALKHGACANQRVLADEDPDEFESFRATLVRDLKPDDSVQQNLALNIVDELWKFRRIARFEAAIIGKAIATAENNYRLSHGPDNSIQKLHARLDAIAERSRATEDYASEGVAGPQVANLEVDHAKDEPRLPAEVSAQPEDAVEQLPEQARRECQEQAFSTIFNDCTLMNFSRYEATSLNILTRCLKLFYQLKEIRPAAGYPFRVIEPMAIAREKSAPNSAETKQPRRSKNCRS